MTFGINCLRSTLLVVMSGYGASVVSKPARFDLTHILQVAVS